MLMPSFSAFWRNEPSVRFVSLEIFATGVRAFECARNSFTSSLVYSRRRTTFFLADLATCWRPPRVRPAAQGQRSETTGWHQVSRALICRGS
jgi:hypothetical protein